MNSNNKITTALQSIINLDNDEKQLLIKLLCDNEISEPKKAKPIVFKKQYYFDLDKFIEHHNTVVVPKNQRRLKRIKKTLEIANS